MLAHVFLSGVLFYSSPVVAQNLIPNGDFELGPDSSAEGWSLWWDSTCNNPVPVNGPDFWTIVFATPDRELEDDIFGGCLHDIDTAQSGRAWVNFGYGEAGKTTLISPLQKDSLYRLSYYYKKESYSNMFPNTDRRVEFRFSQGSNIINSPYTTTNTLWQLHDTMFIALSNSTELEIWGIDFFLGGGSGVKIDNLSLEKISSTGIIEIYNKEEVSIFPNPTRDKFTIKTNAKKFNLEIYNTVGIIIIKQLSNILSQEIDISDFPTGIYFIKVSFSNQTIIQKLIITNN